MVQTDKPASTSHGHSNPPPSLIDLCKTYSCQVEQLRWKDGDKKKEKERRRREKQDREKGKRCGQSKREGQRELYKQEA